MNVYARTKFKEHFPEELKPLVIFWINQIIAFIEMLNNSRNFDLLHFMD